MACTVAISSVESLLLDLHVTEEDHTPRLDNEVVDEPLAETQKKWLKRSEADFDEVMRQLDAFNEFGEVVARSDSVMALCVPIHPISSPEPQAVLPPLPPHLGNTEIITPVITSITTSSLEPPPLQPIQPKPISQPEAVAATTAAAAVPLSIGAVGASSSSSSLSSSSSSSSLSSSPSQVSQPSQQVLGPAQTPTTAVQLPSGVIIQRNPVPANPPSNNAAQPPPGTYQLVMDPRVGGFFVGPVSATGVPSSTQFRGAVPAAVSKNVRSGTQTITAVPTTKSILIPQSTASSAVITSKPPNKITTWTPSTPTNARTINSVGSAVSSVSGTSGGSVSVRAPRGRPPKHSYNVVSASRTISPGAILPGLGPSMPGNQIRPPGVMHQFRAGVPPTGIRTSSVNGPVAVNNGARIIHAHIPADSREVNFNKLGVGKTFPSLVVVAKPIMRMKEFSAATITKDRADLDQQVKELLQNSMTKLTEWLIQQGLVRSSQTCQSHRSATTGEPVNLKLGMYSDVAKFPHSGGYVWICEFCPTQLFVSVFSGSIFEGAPHPPLVLLKLIYHWACQTTASNIVSWVKVESFYVKMFFTQMRAVCTAAVHESYELMGGPNKRVEVGVISLGTAAQDGSTRNVKVEVLGVMDPENKLVRLRAVEPLQEGEKNYKRRFVKILEPLSKWVHKKSTILTDFTVDKGTLHNMGFTTVFQVSVNPENSSEKVPKHSNINVMNYLRRVVPRMFQNALSLLSRQIIQQFLDELTWRERWGPVPSQAYHNIIKHIADQTRANTGTNFLRRLGKISDDPFRDWKYSATEDVQLIGSNPKKSYAPIAPGPPPLAVPVIKANPTVSAVPSVSAVPAVPVGSAIPANPSASMPPPPPRVAATPVANSTAAAPLPLPVLVPLSTSAPPPPAPPPPPSPSSAPEILRPSIDMLPLSIQEVDDNELPPATHTTRRGRKRTGEPIGASIERPRKRTAGDITRKSGPTYSTLVVGTQLATSLQAYYYGTLEGDPAAMNEEKRELPVMKCSVCVRKYSNNIQLMKHLILHTQFSQFSTELSDVTQCKYCMKSFPTPFSMQTHLEEVHLTTTTNDVCMICTEKFKDTSSLISHMHRTHVALEMPYVCNVCQFRSSIHRDLIDHFYEVHNNGEKIQCPFCLKTVSICANGRRLGSNISFFLSHIQKHQRRYIAKKCTRCALWFVNKWAIREHLQRDHVSFKDVAGVKPAFPDVGEGIKMPLPPAELGPSATLSARRGPGFPNRGCQSTTYLLPTLTLQSNITDYLCVECKEELSESHFPGYSMCSRCRFATCCSKNLKVHMKTFHEIEETPVFEFSAPIQLPEPMYCVCGYSAKSGNRLAKHLALCDRKSAYPSAAKAKAATVQSASFPPLVTLDDADNNGEDASDKWLKAFVPPRREESESSKDVPDKKSTGADTHSMLNVLGLVRKPSTDDSSLDKAPSDKEDSTEAPVTEQVSQKRAYNLRRESRELEPKSNLAGTPNQH